MDKKRQPLFHITLYNYHQFARCCLLEEGLIDIFVRKFQKKAESPKFRKIKQRMPQKTKHL